MYLSPFWGGVVFTIVAEVVTLIAWTLYLSAKQEP